MKLKKTFAVVKEVSRTMNVLLLKVCEDEKINFYTCPLSLSFCSL
ncbi:MAG: hypothetical protein K940chlam9_01620 [Chlamydiae bacterium]|nr:hypothetical protein [Chlamydiota bacterium]